MGEDDQPGAHLGNREVTNEADGSGLHDHVFVSNRRVGGSPPPVEQPFARLPCRSRSSTTSSSEVCEKFR